MMEIEKERHTAHLEGLGRGVVGRGGVLQQADRLLPRGQRVHLHRQYFSLLGHFT